MRTRPSSAQTWHSLQNAEVSALLRADLESGLSPAEARRRLEEFGPNRITPRKRANALKRFLREFHDPLVYILLVASVITIFLREYVDAAVILGVVLVNAIVGYVQETKSENAIEALSRMMAPEATVRRGNSIQKIPADQLVPGDLVLLHTGDRIPADLRLVTARNLQVDESPLTGESLPVHKFTGALAHDTVLAERKNLAFAGTTVTAGEAQGLVWATGDHTEAGRIAWLVGEALDLSTPLTRKMVQFTRRLLYVILSLAALAFAAGIWRGSPPQEMFLAAVALAVGAIPEGLPAAVTITLAIGVARMARRKAIIRKLPVVETIGGVTVICSDKTGTLTENQMTVREVFAGGKLYTVTGDGYDANGDFRLSEAAVTLQDEPALLECLKAGLLCNDSQILREKDRAVVRGDPTEAALIVSAHKAGLIASEVHGQHPRVDMIPFESEHMFRATLHHARQHRVIYKVGALERLLDRCADAIDANGTPTGFQKSEIVSAAEQMARRGLRVLAFARRHVDLANDRLEHHHVSAGLTFLGLQGMIDPPRRAAVDSVRRCQDAGIAVKMITGDHALTAAIIAEKVGLRSQSGEIVTISGKQIATLTDTQLYETVDNTSVFARVAPDQKLRLVKALQARGHIVAMTGDGVNDAPALKQADAGIAMGSGADVAKEAADMLLIDDNFATIEAAVEEGRGVFDNLTKFIIWTLPTNTGEALILLTAILLGTSLPVLPTQLLWINLSTSILLGIALVFESKEKDLMSRAPRDPKQPIITFPLFMRTGLVTLIMVAGAFLVFFGEQRLAGATLAQARTAVVNVVVMVEVFYLLNCRSLTRSMFSAGAFSNRWVIGGIFAMVAAQILFTYSPVMNRLFHSAPVDLHAWVRITGIALFAWIVVEFEKWLRFRPTGYSTAPSSVVVRSCSQAMSRLFGA
ncbi:MAG TPA: HAD-IC family P-type ATPase [Verrucomicrobiae bacterium]|nr:HAD-IC family P-type ATPase [Verrucomicrobiae bacterium]